MSSCSQIYLRRQPDAQGRSTSQEIHDHAPRLMVTFLPAAARREAAFDSGFDEGCALHFSFPLRRLGIVANAPPRQTSYTAQPPRSPSNCTPDAPASLARHATVASASMTALDGLLLLRLLLAARRLLLGCSPRIFSRPLLFSRSSFTALQPKSCRCTHSAIRTLRHAPLI